MGDLPTLDDLLGSFSVNFPKSKLRLFSESEFSETKTFSKTKFPKQKPRPQKVGKSLETKKSQKSILGNRSGNQRDKQAQSDE